MNVIHAFSYNNICFRVHFKDHKKIKILPSSTVNVVSGRKSNLVGTSPKFKNIFWLILSYLKKIFNFQFEHLENVLEDLSYKSVLKH